MSMSASEFIGRCLDAANIALAQEMQGRLATTSFQVAGLTLHSLPMPLSYELNDYSFTVEMTDMHEMMQISASMASGDTMWEATMVLSKINNSIIEHWLCHEPGDRCNDMTIFKLMTSNRFNSYAVIQ